MMIFVIYITSFVMICYSIFRQWDILKHNTNGTRLVQKFFLVFNICFSVFVMLKILDLAGFNQYPLEYIRAVLILIMSAVGYVFYSSGK